MNRDIESTASKWAARVDRGTLTAEEQSALDAWLLRSRLHFGAFARARAVLSHFDRAAALGGAYEPDDFRSSSTLRSPQSRRMVRFAAAIVAVALVSAIYLRTSVGVFSTQRGEVRLVPLIDGSAITLNTATKLHVDYSSARREVELLNGEALFSVAHDRARPFIVRAGDTHIRAVGTSFTVRRLTGEDVKVLVREGVVEVTRKGDTVHLPLRLVAQYEAVIRSRSVAAVEPIGSRQIDRELAWQQGMISLDGRTLREAAAEFSRYSRILIVVDDPSIASQTVTGLFAANNPVGFAQAVATSLDLRVEIKTDTVRLFH